MAIVRGGTPLAGAGVGVIVLKTRHPLLPGNVQHAASFRRPVFYEVVPVDDPAALMAGDPSIGPLIVAAGERLIGNGVSVIAGACGSFVYYQQAVAAALPVPVFLSVMLAAPMLLAALGPERKIGVLASALSAMNPRALAAAGITDTRRIVFREFRCTSQFDALLAQDETFDAAKMEEEVVAVAAEAVAADPAIGLFLIQCSDIPPFAQAIYRRTGRPCFDAVGLIEWLTQAARPPRYAEP